MTDGRHYEIVLLIHPDRSAQVPDMIARYKKSIEAGGGAVHRVEDWGRRHLAYPIMKLLKAHYIAFNIECNQSVLDKLEEGFRFNDAVIRHLTLREKSAPVGESIMMKNKDKEKDRRRR